VIKEQPPAGLNDPFGGVTLGLHRATHVTIQALVKLLAWLELGPSEINVLACLAAVSPVPAGLLGTATGTKPSTLTSVLDRLAGRGFATREVDPADRRSFLVSLTPAGQVAADQVSDAIRELERQALSQVTDSERAGFVAVVQALTEVAT
jgi:MarR family transcriptional regulator, organic hydroperoxide resistance regulator